MNPLHPIGKIRQATASDAESIQGIYAPYISDTAITFETEIPTINEIRERIAVNSKYGWFVFEVDSEVAGYAYACKHRDRAAYDWCCEVSVYVKPEFHRRGIARALYTHLLKNLKNLGLVNAYAGITLPNKSSVTLHESLGFNFIGAYKDIGFKLGQWHDVGWWEYKINPPVSNPEKPRFA